MKSVNSQQQKLIIALFIFISSLLGLIKKRSLKKLQEKREAKKQMKKRQLIMKNTMDIVSKSFRQNSEKQTIDPLGNDDCY